MDGDTVGVDLGGTRLLLRCRETEEAFGTGPSFTPEDLLLHLGAFVARHKLHPGRIGVAVPGLVEAGGRVAECDVLPSFRGWDARAALRDMGGPVVILNDVRAALTEEMHDAPPGVTGGVVMVGTAVGAAFVADGRPLLGASGWAGELGYLPILCGDETKRLDEVAGGAAIATACGVPPGVVARRAADGDAAVLHAVAQAGKAFGLGLAAVINLLNPSVLRVGGGTSELPGYWEAALASADRSALTELWRDCTLSRASAGTRAVVLGAMRAAGLTAV